MAKLTTFRSVKYTPLVGKHSEFHRTLIPWQQLTENVISQQNPGKPICRNSNANSEPLNWANMPSYSGLENARCKVPDFKTYCHVVPYKFPVSVSVLFFWATFRFLARARKGDFGLQKLSGCRLPVNCQKYF